MLNTKNRSRKRKQARCFCSKCNGIYVDPRTKKKHLMNRNIVTNTSAVSLQNRNENNSNENEIENEIENENKNDSNVESSQHSLINEEFSAKHQKDASQSILYSKLRKRNRESTSWRNKDNYEETNIDTSNEDDEDNEDNDDDETYIFEDYSSPKYDFPENFNDLLNLDEEWIIIYILRFQTRFRLADTAIDTLIKFVKHVLTKLDSDRFENFPTSLYTARKKLGLKHQFVTFSVCPSCHKLHNVEDIKQHTIQGQKAVKKCGHIQFPNNHRFQQCDTPLSEQKELGMVKSLIHQNYYTQWQILNNNSYKCIRDRTLKKISDYGPIEMSTKKSCVTFMMAKFGKTFQSLEKYMMMKKFPMNKNSSIRNMQMII